MKVVTVEFSCSKQVSTRRLASPHSRARARNVLWHVKVRCHPQSLFALSGVAHAVAAIMITAAPRRQAFVFHRASLTSLNIPSCTSSSVLPTCKHQPIPFASSSRAISRSLTSDGVHPRSHHHMQSRPNVDCPPAHHWSAHQGPLTPNSPKACRSTTLQHVRSANRLTLAAPETLAQ